MATIVEVTGREIQGSRGDPTIPLRFNGGLRNNLEPRGSNLLRVKAVWGVQTTLKGCASVLTFQLLGTPNIKVENQLLQTPDSELRTLAREGSDECPIPQDVSPH